jgi:two-component system nitrate/nitrite response regulator NarL
MASAALLIQNPLFSARLAALLRTMGYAPVHEGADLYELKNRADDAPDLLLIKLQRQGSGNIFLTEAIRFWSPLTKVVFLASALNLATLSACFAAGAAGYLLEDISRAGLIYSLTLVAGGEKVFPSELADMLSNSFKQKRTTKILKFSRDQHQPAG